MGKSVKEILLSGKICILVSKNYLLVSKYLQKSDECYTWYIQLIRQSRRVLKIKKGGMRCGSL